MPPSSFDACAMSARASSGVRRWRESRAPLCARLERLDGLRYRIGLSAADDNGSAGATELNAMARPIPRVAPVMTAMRPEVESRITGLRGS